MMFDTEKTKAFFGLAADFVEKFRTRCEHERFDTPEAVAHALSSLTRFGLWNIPGMAWADRMLDRDGCPRHVDVSAHELLHDAIFRTEDPSMRYPLLDSGFTRGGITKLLMNVEQGATFYPHPWFDPELLVLAAEAREVPGGAPIETWTEKAREVITKLWTQSYFDRLRTRRQLTDLSAIEVITAFVAPSAVTALYCFDATEAYGVWRPFAEIVATALEELPVSTEPLPPVTGTHPEDVSPLVPPNGNGKRYQHGNDNPSISMLAGHFGETLLGHRSADPMRELFERSQAMPKHEIRGGAPNTNVSQIVTDTVSLVSQLINIPGVTADKALDAAVQLLRPTAPKDEN